MRGYLTVINGFTQTHAFIMSATSAKITCCCVNSLHVHHQKLKEMFIKIVGKKFFQKGHKYKKTDWCRQIHLWLISSISYKTWSRQKLYMDATASRDKLKRTNQLIVCLDVTITTWFIFFLNIWGHQKTPILLKIALNIYTCT